MLLSYGRKSETGRNVLASNDAEKQASVSMLLAEYVFCGVKKCWQLVVCDAPSTVCELGKRIIMEISGKKVFRKLTHKEASASFFSFGFSHHSHLFEVFTSLMPTTGPSDGCFGDGDYALQCFQMPDTKFSVLIVWGKGGLPGFIQ
ncbi:unnamed protein product [Sphenostylis stenocarpa]|uniref:Uncharacterized protein n=1 Tax=Sphenostylis stenocarpa TaxID=92480 RepID=A0AA86S9A5_9FABA|nr:unnamed protein product [Sphenostylis stenocarpa]